MSHSTIFVLNSPEDLEWKLKVYNENSETNVTLDDENFFAEERCVSEERFYDNGFIDGYHDEVSNMEADEIIDDLSYLENYLRDYASIYEYSTGKFMIKFTREGVEKYVKETITEIEEQLKNLKGDAGCFDYWKLKRVVNGDPSGYYFYESYTYYTVTEWFMELYNYFKTSNKDYFVYYLDDALDYHC